MIDIIAYWPPDKSVRPPDALIESVDRVVAVVAQD